MHYLYRITNLISNKIYIGQTNSPSLRWAQHKCSAKKDFNSNQLITRAIRKYGALSFKFEVILTCKTRDDANLAEIELIKQYDSMNLAIGYNLDPGGKNNPRSSETIRKVVAGRKKYFETHDGWAKGKKFSDEHKKALSKAAIGKVGTNTGRKFSEEWKKKISAGQIGRKASEETKRRLSESHMGQIASNRKLTIQQAESIREQYSTGSFGQKELGKLYGVSQDTVFKIIKNRTYNKE